MFYFKISRPSQLSLFFGALFLGHVVINATCGDFSVVYYHLTVQKSADWTVVADVIGWLYFAAWSVSFYPQIFDNWKRKRLVSFVVYY